MDGKYIHRVPRKMCAFCYMHAAHVTVISAAGRSASKMRCRNPRAVLESIYTGTALTAERASCFYCTRSSLKLTGVNVMHHCSMEPRVTHVRSFFPVYFPLATLFHSRLRLTQSCLWVGKSRKTRGLGWVESGMGRKFVF